MPKFKSVAKAVEAILRKDHPILDVDFDENCPRFGSEDAKALADATTAEICEHLGLYVGPLHARADGRALLTKLVYLRLNLTRSSTFSP